MHKWIPATVGLTLLLSPPVFSQDRPSTASAEKPPEKERQRPRQSPLITAAALKEMLGRKNVRVIDVGPVREEYDQGHIQGAVFVHWIKDITDAEKADRYNVVSPATMQELLRSLGVRRQDHLVLYDNLSSRLATRLYWSLKVYKHPNVSVLDGGRNAWATAGYEFTRDVPVPIPSEYKVTKIDSRISVDLPFISKHLTDPNVALVDGRPPAQYSGEEPGRVFHTGVAHKLRGHIPGAVNVFWKDNFNPDGTFKSVDQLRRLYKERGVLTKKHKTVVTYCNEGLHAAPPWFVLSELLGVKDARVYDDSMSEWGNSDQPVEKSETKEQPDRPKSEPQKQPGS